VTRFWVIHSRWPLRLHRVRPRRWLPKGPCRFRVMVRQVVFELTGQGRRGICVTGQVEKARDFLPPAVWPNVWGYPSMKKRTSKGPAETVRHLAAMETSLLAGLMPLVEHCAIRQYDDGDSRETGWLTIKTQGSAWCVQVKDPDSCTSFTAVAESLDKALETAALLLSCDDAPWEQDKWLADAAPRRKKK